MTETFPKTPASAPAATVRAPKPKMPVIYIAGPFRGRTRWDVAQNTRRATFFGLIAALNGAMPLIPHANSELFDGQLTDDFWLYGTAELLRRCDGIIAIPGHQRSKGSLAEIAIAADAQMPALIFGDTRDAYPTDESKKHIANFLYQSFGVFPPLPSRGGSPTSGSIS